MILLLLLFPAAVISTSTLNETRKIIPVGSPEECTKKHCPDLPDLCDKNEAFCSVNSTCESDGKCVCNVRVKCEVNHKHKNVFHIDYDIQGESKIKVDVSVRVMIQGDSIIMCNILYY